MTKVNVEAAVRGAAVGVATLLMLGACADQPAATGLAPSAAAADRSAAGMAGMAGMSGMSGMGSQMSLKEGALYVATLHPLNARAQQALDPDPASPHGVAQGTAYFRVVGGMLHAVVDVAGAEPAEGAFPDGLHPQHIHAAAQCPPGSADTNGDGFVDVIEGLPFYGDILVPLDGNIGNTTSEIPTFPRAMGERGTYHYEASASLTSLEQAIGGALALPSRHVVIHGVDLATPLPASVRSLPGIPAQLTLPIACGEIREVR
jgi:hypothetical protein